MSNGSLCLLDRKKGREASPVKRLQTTIFYSLNKWEKIPIFSINCFGGGRIAGKNATVCRNCFDGEKATFEGAEGNK